MARKHREANLALQREIAAGIVVPGARPVEKTKKRCLNCGSLFPDFLSECPNCAHIQEIASISSFCPTCGQRFANEQLPDHVARRCRRVRSSCVECRIEHDRGDNHSHEPGIIEQDTPARVAIPTKPSVIGTMMDPSRSRFVTGICHHCGARAMMNSTACYTCKDK